MNKCYTYIAHMLLVLLVSLSRQKADNNPLHLPLRLQDGNIYNLGPLILHTYNSFILNPLSNFYRLKKVFLCSEF